jgi:hypothetical protein
MLAAVDLDRHPAGNPGQLIGAGIRDDGNGQLRRPAVYYARVLENESAALSVQHAADSLGGNVTGRDFHQKLRLSVFTLGAV